MLRLVRPQRPAQISSRIAGRPPRCYGVAEDLPAVLPQAARRLPQRLRLCTATFLKIGLIPGDGGAWLLPRTIGWSRAAQLYFTGDVVDAKTACEWGLVSEVYPDDQLMAEAEKLAKKICQQPPQALRMTKRLMRDGMTASFDTIMEMSAAMQVLVQRTDDHVEAVNAFFEKREPKFEGK